MTFEEQAAELHALDALAMSLGLSDAEFVRIAKVAIEDAYTEGTISSGPLEKIRECLVEYGRHRAVAMRQVDGTAECCRRHPVRADAQTVSMVDLPDRMTSDKADATAT